MLPTEEMVEEEVVEGCRVAERVLWCLRLWNV
jgi:hypothetical protein